MTGQLTTHVLDTTHGKPAHGMTLTLFRLEEEGRARLGEAVTNRQGRCDAPLLTGPDLAVGTYELVFEVGSYFRALGLELPRPAFLERVPIRFGIAEEGAHYHVPLLVSPFSYTTYRGS